MEKFIYFPFCFKKKSRGDKGKSHEEKKKLAMKKKVSLRFPFHLIQVSCRYPFLGYKKIFHSLFFSFSVKVATTAMLHEQQQQTTFEYVSEVDKAEKKIGDPLDRKVMMAITMTREMHCQKL